MKKSRQPKLHKLVVPCVSVLRMHASTFFVFIQPCWGPLQYHIVISFCIGGDFVQTNQISLFRDLISMSAMLKMAKLQTKLFIFILSWYKTLDDLKNSVLTKAWYLCLEFIAIAPLTEVMKNKFSCNLIFKMFLVPSKNISAFLQIFWFLQKLCDSFQMLLGSLGNI